jgi:hypothetical protein
VKATKTAPLQPRIIQEYTNGVTTLKLEDSYISSVTLYRDNERLFYGTYLDMLEASEEYQRIRSYMG